MVAFQGPRRATPTRLQTLGSIFSFCVSISRFNIGISKHYGQGETYQISTNQAE